MSDIVEALNQRISWAYSRGNDLTYTLRDLSLDRQVLAEIERLRGALALFACDCAPKIECVDPKNCRNSIARAALAAAKKEGK